MSGNLYPSLTAALDARLPRIASLSRRAVRWVRDRRQIRRWEAAGRPNPPPHRVKQQNIKGLARQYGLTTFVETGTFHGQTLEEMCDRFQRLYSIEIDDTLYRAAAEKFAPHRHITVLHGDSGTLLAELLPTLRGQKKLFWLDGHYSGSGTGRADADTPVIAELDHIHRYCEGDDFVIMIDDAREFGTNPDYPQLDVTLADIERKFGVKPVVMDDAIVAAVVRTSA